MCRWHSSSGSVGRRRGPNSCSSAGELSFLGGFLLACDRHHRFGEGRNAANVNRLVSLKPASASKVRNVAIKKNLM
jgi:hypothetical protein